MDKYDVLLVVKSPVMATLMSQNLNNVTIRSFGSSTMGGRYDLVLVLDPVDGESQVQTDTIRNWLNASVRTQVKPDGHYFEVYRREAPDQNYPPDRSSIVAPGGPAGGAAPESPSE